MLIYIYFFIFEEFLINCFLSIKRAAKASYNIMYTYIFFGACRFHLFYSIYLLRASEKSEANCRLRPFKNQLSKIIFDFSLSLDPLAYSFIQHNFILIFILFLLSNIMSRRTLILIIK